MIDFVTHQDAIKTWVEAQTGVVAQFRGERQVLSYKTRAQLNIMASQPLGVDERRWDLDGALSPPDDFVPTISGLRQFTLSVLIESRDQRADKTARYILEKLRTSLRKPSVLSDFYTAGLAVIRSEPLKNLDRVVDDRLESASQMDVMFSVAANETDNTEGISYADKAEITGTLDEVERFTDEIFGNV